MWVDKKDIFPIPCYLASSDLWWLNQMKISLHGYIVTFDLTVLILLSPSWLSIFYKFVLLSFLFSCYPRIFNFCPILASLARLILQLPGKSEFHCFEFIFVIFEALYIFSPIFESDLSESFFTYFARLFSWIRLFFLPSVCCCSVSPVLTFSPCTFFQIPLLFPFFVGYSIFLIGSPFI